MKIVNQRRVKSYARLVRTIKALEKSLHLYIPVKMKMMAEKRKRKRKA